MNAVRCHSYLSGMQWWSWNQILIYQICYQCQMSQVSRSVFSKLSKIVSIVKNYQNCHQSKIVIKICHKKLSLRIVIKNCHQKLSSKIVIKNCHQKMSSKIVINVSKITSLWGHSVLLWTLWLLVVPNQGTRSPIELFWTAKKDFFWFSLSPTM